MYQEEINNKIDWVAREKELQKIAQCAQEKAKQNGSNYDCVIGISGGKDSTFQALYARDKMGLRALLVNCEPEGITEVGRKNIENLKNLGFDTITVRPNPKIIRRLIKGDFYKYVNPVKVTEFPLWASAYRIAHVLQIPLIIQGENDCLTLGLRNKQGLGGDAMLVTEQDTVASGWQNYLSEEGIDAKDLFLYHFDPEKMRQETIQAIWLQYYAKEWSYSHNIDFSVKHGLQGRINHDPNKTGRLSPYCSIDCDLQIVNQLLKYLKFGFGFVTDEVCYYIREGKMNRREAAELVKKYDGKCDVKYIQDFCDYIGINLDEFWKVANSARGPMWKRDEKGEWRLDNPIWEQQV